jgi:hypothetical protein
MAIDQPLIHRGNKGDSKKAEPDVSEHFIVIILLRFQTCLVYVLFFQRAPFRVNNS